MEVSTRHPSRTAEPEYRWPAVVALLGALALYAFLPNTLVGGQRFVVVTAGIAFLVAISIVNPHRLTRQPRWYRWVSVGFAALLVLVNQVALVIIVTGSGRRVAESYDGTPAGAPLLHVEYAG